VALLRDVLCGQLAKAKKRARRASGALSSSIVIPPVGTVELGEAEDRVIRGGGSGTTISGTFWRSRTGCGGRAADNRAIAAHAAPHVSVVAGPRAQRCRGAASTSPPCRVTPGRIHRLGTDGRGNVSSRLDLSNALHRARRRPAIGSARRGDGGRRYGLAERCERRGAGAWAGPVRGRHHVFGVGTFAVDAVLEATRLVRAAGETGSRRGVGGDD